MLVLLQLVCLCVHSSQQGIFYEKRKEKMEKITVFTKAYCQACVATKRKLKELGVSFEEIRVDKPENFGAYETLVAEGWKEMPVVKTEKNSWSGYKPDQLLKLSNS